MPVQVKWQRVEFYDGDLDNKILVRDGLHFIPREGELLALGEDIFKVALVSYNLDYLETGYEVWRANVILNKRERD